MAWKSKLTEWSITVVGGAAIGLGLCSLLPEEKTTEIQEREIVRTIYRERPDGTREVINERERKRTAKTEVKRKKKDWIIGAGTSLTEREPVYHVSIDRRVFIDGYVGVYGRTDGEIGVSVKWTF